MKNKATSFDIAHMAGVSQSTVSRALSDSPLVNKETRDKIKQIAKELNYKVDKNASNLRKQHSQTLALLLFEDPTSDDSLINPFFISMLGSITKASSAAGYDLLVSFQNLNDDWHADYEDSNKADGIILLGYGSFTDYEHKLYQLEEQGTRYLRWGAPDQNHPGVSIGCDNYQGGIEVTKHLLQVGHRSFGFIGEVGDAAPEFKARFDGFNKALDDVGIRFDHNNQKDAISTEQAGFEAAKSLLENNIPDALVCASDLIALGAIRAVRSKGLKVPKDIAVVGYDNIQVSEFAATPLTTVYQNTQLAGELLVSNLLKLIKQEPVSDYLMPPELIVRESCGVNQPVER
ncbi:LacI family DNA-binding transcriptional regulator [Glaciecola sp. KUL10]|uniref:LacI family DNA-binding transcriptional regulator n=1 Tax=Glaciecola sp. (strain KUL10) TaxID=2161813 RepID=UPI000D78C3DF|nr:LacI family DNA-binding transcriptional regulator [Glaciecola sp. KUL10]GBL05378.1 sugar-binding protein [Glaciecola sp. KUL10]